MLKKDWPIIGNEQIVNFLKSTILIEKISQAYLFVGPPKLGKRLVADIFCNTILCRDPISKKIAFPCGKCTMCQQFQKGIHSEFLVLTKERDKKNISVEAVRSFQHEFNTTSILGGIKIGIIDDAADLSKEGANALLKTLEEPLGESIIILITTSQDSLPATIISRCQILSFQLVARSVIASHLEKLGCLKKDAEKLAALAFGRPGRAINFFKHPSLLKKFEKEIEDFFKIFHKGIPENFLLLQQYLGIGKYQDRIKRTEEMINICSSIIRDIILFKKEKYNQIVYLDYIEKLKQLSQSFSLLALLKKLKELTAFRELLNQNINPQLIFENYLLNLKSYA